MVQTRNGKSLVLFYLTFVSLPSTHISLFLSHLLFFSSLPLSKLSLSLSLSQLSPPISLHCPQTQALKIALSLTSRITVQHTTLSSSHVFHHSMLLTSHLQISQLATFYCGICGGFFGYCLGFFFGGGCGLSFMGCNWLMLVGYDGGCGLILVVWLILDFSYGG